MASYVFFNQNITCNTNRLLSSWVRYEGISFKDHKKHINESEFSIFIVDSIPFWENSA